MVNAYSFQGQEKDDEIKGNGNSINYKYRMHDPRLGRFFAVDPLAAEYPHNSVYAFSENKVIHAVELEGLESVELSSGKVIGTGPVTSETAIETAENNLGEGEYISKYVDGSIGLPALNVSPTARKDTYNPKFDEPSSSSGIDDVSSVSGFVGATFSFLSEGGKWVGNSSIYQLASKGLFRSAPGFYGNTGIFKMNYPSPNTLNILKQNPLINSGYKSSQQALKFNPLVNSSKAFSTIGNGLGFLGLGFTVRSYINGDMGGADASKELLINGAALRNPNPYTAALSLGYNSGYLIEYLCDCNIQLNMDAVFGQGKYKNKGLFYDTENNNYDLYQQAKGQYLLYQMYNNIDPLTGYPNNP